MNCTNPIQIYNRSSKLSLRGSALTFTVPCGQCEACKKNKWSEYALRSYVEYKDTESKGGYVYFDTLTYADKFIPKHFGIRHFSRAHINLMLKELRVYLTRAGFRVNGNLKYFIASEYGGKTHRPHYHVLFFITVPNLDVKTFWLFLNKAWKFGFIDRYATAPNRVVNSTAALNYIAKYVQKDQEWQEVVDRRIKKLTRISGADKLLAHLDDMKPFHRQSQGFGINFLKFVELEDIMRNACITIPDRQYYRKNYAIPMYYKRKLFYNLVRDENDKLHWKLNELGKKYKINHLDSNIDNVENNYKNILHNIKLYNLQSFDVDTTLNLVDKYLDGRTLHDFAVYLVCYRHKLLNRDSSTGGFIKLPDYATMFKMSLEEGNVNNYLYDDSAPLRSKCKVRLDKIKISQDKYHCFRYFDDLFNLFKAVTNYFNIGLETKPREIRSLRDRLKLILN